MALDEPLLVVGSREAPLGEVARATVALTRTHLDALLGRPLRLHLPLRMIRLRIHDGNPFKLCVLPMFFYRVNSPIDPMGEATPMTAPRFNIYTTTDSFVGQMLYHVPFYDTSFCSQKNGRDPEEDRART